MLEREEKTSWGGGESVALCSGNELNLEGLESVERWTDG